MLSALHRQSFRLVAGFRHFAVQRPQTITYSFALLAAAKLWRIPDDGFVINEDSINAFTILPAITLAAQKAETKIQEVKGHIRTSSNTLRDVITALQQGNLQRSSQLLVRPKNDKEATKATLQLHKGINISSSDDSNEKVITIFSRGYARNDYNPLRSMPRIGGGLFAAYTYIRNSVINFPASVITFDYPDHRRFFNFAQAPDQAIIKKVYNDVVDQILPAVDTEANNAKTNNAKDPRIVFAGDCRGALNILRFVGENNPKFVDTLVLECPFVSAKKMTDRMAEISLPWIPYGGRILYNVFVFWFPNYKSLCQDPKELLSRIKDKNIFIGHRQDDLLISADAMATIVSTLSKNNKVYFWVVDKDEDNTASHSAITNAPSFQKAVNAFYKEVNLPHDEELALSGSKLLDVALINSDTDVWKYLHA